MDIKKGTSKGLKTFLVISFIIGILCLILSEFLAGFFSIIGFVALVLTFILSIILIIKKSYLLGIIFLILSLIFFGILIFTIFMVTTFPSSINSHPEAKILWSVQEGNTNPGKLVSTSFGNETDLFITGKSWYISMNLLGYEDMDYKTNQEQFFAKSKVDSNTGSFIYITPSAWSLQGIDSAYKCREYDLPWHEQFTTNISSNKLLLYYEYSNITQEEIDGKLLLTYSLKNKSSNEYYNKVIYYFDYKEGYCFVYHITAGLDARSTQEAHDLLDSIKIVTG